MPIDAPQSAEPQANAEAAKPEVVHIDQPVGGPIDDVAIAPVAADAPEPVAAAPEVVAAPPPKLARHDRAQQIADRLKAKRSGETAPEFTGDMSDPAQNMGQVAVREPEPVAPPPAEPVAEPSAPTKTIKLKVRGQDVELSEEERNRAAQIGLAGEDYLREAREKRDEADRILKLASRTAPANGQHPDHDSAPEPVAEPVAAAPSATPRARDRLKQVIEDVQFGNDPEAAADNLLATISDTVREETDGRTLRTKMDADFRDTMQTFETWKGENKEIATALASDPNAAAVMERMLLTGYREDLVAIGIPADQVPKTPTELVDWHRFYRVEGHKVRNAKQLLSDTQGKYVEWRTGSAPAPKPAPATTATTPPPAAPPPATPGTHVRVAIDRGGRRATIPTQPARSAAPQSVPQPQQAGNSRSAAIQKAKAARGQRVVTA
jgi:hypothetical protein